MTTADLATKIVDEQVLPSVPGHKNEKEAAREILIKFLMVLHAENQEKINLQKLAARQQFETQVIALMLSVLCFLQQAVPNWDDPSLVAQFRTLGLKKPSLNKILGAVVPVAK